MGRFLSLMLAMCALFFEGFAQRQVQGIARPDLNTGKTNFRSGTGHRTKRIKRYIE